MWSSASKLNRKDSSIHCSFTVTTVKTAGSSATLSGAKEIPPFLTKNLKYNATTIYTLSLEKRHKSTHTYAYSVAYAYPEDAQSSGWPVPLPGGSLRSSARQCLTAFDPFFHMITCTNRCLTTDFHFFSHTAASVCSPKSRPNSGYNHPFRVELPTQRDNLLKMCSVKTQWYSHIVIIKLCGVYVYLF